MTKILILGGGFGGIRATLDLSKKFKGRKDIGITLLDKNSSQTFFPALYEVASVFGIDHEHPFHTKLEGTILIPHSEIFKGTGIELVQAEISGIDLGSKSVNLSSGAKLSFDYLVIALGSAVSTYGIPGVEEYACKFKSIEDAVMLNDKLEELFSSAANGTKAMPVNILIGGAGFTGIELAAELSNCAAHIAHRHKITQENCTSVTLIEAAPAILPMVSEKERSVIKKRLTRLGVNLMENSAIQEVGPDFMKLKDGKILKGDLIIWTAGVKALDMFKNILGLELDDKGRIAVNKFLQLKNYPNVFAVGDNIIFTDEKTQKPVPQMAYVAIEQGSIAASNIAELVFKGQTGKLKAYKPYYDVWIAPVGGKYALSHIGKMDFKGYMGHLIRGAVDLRYFLNTLPFFKALKLFFRGIRTFSKND